jgi:glycosyltransferase involved in cell wall biosynthesis
MSASLKVLRVGIDARVLGQRGVGRYLSNLLAAMARQRGPWEFTLFVNERSRLNLVPKDPRFKIVSLGASHPAYAEQFSIPALAMKLHLDLLHYPDNTGCVTPPLPMVLTMHDGMWQRPLRDALLYPTLRQRLQDRYRKWVCPRAARAARAVITVSGFSAKELRASLSLKNLVTIPLGLDPHFKRRLAPKAIGAELGALGLSKPYVLCSGAADRRKNIDFLIGAFAAAKLGSCELVVTSLRPGEQATTRFEQSAREAGLTRRVRFLGFVTDTQLQALYQGALCYAFPSLWEGFGLSILEAYACGTPVLASSAGALPEVAGKAALLADPMDLGAWARGLERLCRAKRGGFADKGRRELKRFSWERAAKKTLEVYRAAARRP